MSITVPAPVRRWLVPASAALAVIGGGVAIGVITNAADSALPPRTAEELLVDLQTAQVDGLQGTLTFRADLGLPPLPVPSLGSADLGSLASGTHTLRVWYANPGQARIALLGRDNETDIVTNGTDVWIWSSRDRTALHAQLPPGGIAGLVGALLGQGPLAELPGGSALQDMADATRSAGPRALDEALEGRPMVTDPPTPADPLSVEVLPGRTSWDPAMMARLALMLLEAFDTDVTTDSGATVAGRPAYQLTLTPRDPRTLIKSIVLAVDAEAHIPLRLAVLTRDGGAPAFEVAFTELRLVRPDPAQFEFKPPVGTTVVEADELDLTELHRYQADGHAPSTAEASGAPRETSGASGLGDDSTQRPAIALIGQGWTTVFAARLPETFGAGDGDSSTPELLELLPVVSGDWGSGRLLSTRVFTVLLTDDGRLLAGAVPPDLLYAAADDPAAQFGS